MNRIELGLTDRERQIRADARRTRNCFIAMLMIAAVAGAIITYFE